MWTKLVPRLRCPLCRRRVKSYSFESREDDSWIETGVLLCDHCKVWHPVVRGVPVLLPYSTGTHMQFAREEAGRLSAQAAGCVPPAGTPPPGEQLVMRSFSTEWLEYDFDGVIWEMDYAEHERRFMQEVGHHRPRSVDACFLEIGCGLGITTAMAQKNFGGEAIGVDLSLAAWRATAAHRSNPALHFVQASVFALPFDHAVFDLVYTRGVLHHTFSTRAAFLALAPFCRPNGSIYVWIYGPRSINDNLFRRLIYGAEVAVRFVLNRTPQRLASGALAPFALAYMAFNRLRRSRNPSIQPYNFTRALHAARDRFTPEFAHRHDAAELCDWFREAGFTDLDVVDWRSMPSADHDDYRRNTGVRGRRAARVEAAMPVALSVASR